LRFGVNILTHRIPLCYRMMFVSLIKQALKISDTKYYENLYYYEDKRNKATKPFTFSVKLNGFSINSTIIELEKGLTFFIGSPDQKFILNLYNGIKKLKNFSYRDYEITLKRTFALPEKKIMGNKVILKTMSPIHIKSKTGDSISPSSKDFVTELNYISDLILRNFRGNGLKKRLQFKPLNMKKVIVKEDISDVKELKYLYIKAWKGSFVLIGEQEDLNDLYKLGIGFRRNQGFGMVEVV